MALPTFSAFRGRLNTEFGIKERPISEMAFVPPHWHATGTGLFWERFIPPGKKLRLPIPDLPEDVPMEAEAIMFFCRYLKISPKAFGLPWN